MFFTGENLESVFFLPFSYINAFVMLVIVYFCYTIRMLETFTLFFFFFLLKGKLFCVSNYLELHIQVSVFRENCQMGLLICLLPLMKNRRRKLVP